MINGIHHTCISTPDIARSVAFYRDVIGFELCFETVFDDSKAIDAMLRLEDVAVRMVMMRSGTSFLEILQFDSPVGRPARADLTLADRGITHICLTVDDIDTEYARLCAAGMRFNAPPLDVGPMSFCYGVDPDGNHVELLQVRDKDFPYHPANHRIGQTAS